MKHIKSFNESTENLNISDVMKRINDLKDEYERIRNYEYDQYGDEFDAMDRKRDIQMIFYTLGIDFDKFDR
ncbi:MAG: hypothetical protein RBT65_16340 [Methanolobus sp.]|nr:hypothetical protein [Methanolobus sp.]